MAAGVRAVDEGMQKIARILIVLGILVIDHIAVGGVGMTGRSLTELMDIAHGCQQRQQSHGLLTTANSSITSAGRRRSRLRWRRVRRMGRYVRQAGTR